MKSLKNRVKDSRSYSLSIEERVEMHEQSYEELSKIKPSLIYEKAMEALAELRGKDKDHYK